MSIPGLLGASSPGGTTLAWLNHSGRIVKAEVAVAQVKTWLRGQGKSPREEALKERLRTVLLRDPAR